MEENNEYRYVPGYEGLYMVNRNGDIITLRNKNGRYGTKIKPYIDQDGYCRVALYPKDGKRLYIGVHKVVAMTFLENPNNCRMVNHKNYNRSDNRVSNLEWCTPQENINWSKAHLNGYGHKKVIGTRVNGDSVTYNSLSDAARATGVCVSNITRCCKGRCNMAGMIHWEYNE